MRESSRVCKFVTQKCTVAGKLFRSCDRSSIVKRAELAIPNRGVNMVQALHRVRYTKATLIINTIHMVCSIQQGSMCSGYDLRILATFCIRMVYCLLDVWFYLQNATLNATGAPNCNTIRTIQFMDRLYASFLRSIFPGIVLILCAKMPCGKTCT